MPHDKAAPKANMIQFMHERLIDLGIWGLGDLEIRPPYNGRMRYTKLVGLVALLSASPAFAQSTTDGQTSQTNPKTTQTPAPQTPRITEPPVTVTAQKEPA